MTNMSCAEYDSNYFYADDVDFVDYMDYSVLQLKVYKIYSLFILVIWYLCKLLPPRYCYWDQQTNFSNTMLNSILLELPFKEMFHFHRISPEMQVLGGGLHEGW